MSDYKTPLSGAFGFVKATPAMTDSRQISRAIFGATLNESATSLLALTQGSPDAAAYANSVRAHKGRAAELRAASAPISSNLSAPAINLSLPTRGLGNTGKPQPLQFNR